ncbi:MAG: C45 family peptidase [bacterium]
MTTATIPTLASLPDYERHAGIHVVRLAGSDREMGYRHGLLLGHAIRRGPVPYFARYVDRLLRENLGGVGGPLAKLLASTVSTRVARRFPPHVREALDGLAEGAELDRKLLVGAITMPETFLWAISRYTRVRGFEAAPRFGVPHFGCTSAFAWGAASRDGRFRHGRNFDYQGVGAWDRESAVFFYAPTGAQRYVSISAAGIHLGGITAMNEAGLTLAVHQHLSTVDVALGGLPVGIAGDSVMREARNLDDARRILDEHRPNGSWTYLVGSAREQAVLCYEVTAARRAWFHADGDTFGYSNMYLDRDLASTERFTYPSQWRWNAARYHRVNEILADQRGALDADAISAILGDVGDGSCRISRAIAALMTVGSTVMSPDEGLVWVGTGRAPTSSRPFVAFDLTRAQARPDLGTLTGGEAASAEAAPAFDCYRDAYEAYFNHEDLSAARRHMQRACAARPREALFHFIAGLLALLGDDGGAALAELTEAVTLGHPDAERAATFALWRARALDRTGAREQAVAQYAAIADADPLVRAAARRGVQAPWDGRRVAIDFAFADAPTP